MLPHMPVWVTLLAMTASLLILSWFGIRGFLRRVLT
jgi:hypothetical protein